MPTITCIVLYLFILLVLWVLFKNVLLPYRLYSYYKKQLKDKNYRSYNVKFIPFIAPSIINSMVEMKKFKDAQYSAKYIGPGYDLVLTNLASRIALILISPKLIKEFYQLDGSPVYIKEKTFITSLKRLVKDSITFAQGEQWKMKRKFDTKFFNYEYINKEIPTILDIVNRKLQEGSKGQKEFEVYMLELLQQMTSATMIQLFFGGGSTKAENLQIEGKKVSTFMRQVLEHLGELTLDPISFILGQQFPEKNLRAKDRLVTHQLQKFKQFLTNFVKDRIYEIEQGISNKQDYVKKAYDQTTKEERTPQFMTKLAFDFSSLYVAGTDTTSHSAMMVIYYIIMHPEVQNKLLEEIDKHIKSDEDIVSEKIKEMIYLDCVIHESMRIYQPANGIFFREATTDHMLGDVKVLKGTLLLLSSLSNHYNPEYFENPTQFRPERWLTQQGKLKIQAPYTWLTFSAGPRSCLGKQLALTQMKVIAIQLLRKYKMTMQTTDLTMKTENLSYQPQKLMTRFVKK